MRTVNRNGPLSPSVDRPPRSGTVAVEFLMAFPIAFIFFLAVAEFGLFLTNLRHVEASAFEGARSAARLDKKHLNHAVRDARFRVDRTLQTAGLRRSCLVMIEHNVPGNARRRQVIADKGCRISGKWYRSLPDVENVRAIRCTVAVPMRSLAPDLLSFVGFSIRKKTVYATVIVPYCGGKRKHKHHHGKSRNTKHPKDKKAGDDGDDDDDSRDDDD